jgi:ADP-heptose:LPS heptosyltransferase
MVTPVCISRWSGLGDVCMALAAAHAYKAVNGGWVVVCTDPKYHQLARACPFVDGVVSLPPPGIQEVQLHAAFHGLNPGHEVDSFCRALGLGEVEPELKTLEIRVPVSAQARVASILSGHPLWHRSILNHVVLHPGSIDPNRTWPEAHWVELANLLLWRGAIVYLIGGEHGCFMVEDKLDPLAPVHNVRNLIGLLNPLETIEVLRQSSALVSTDGGPIQLAGATETHIFGIYSVASGAMRLPYRTAGRQTALVPTCEMYPCYLHTNNPTIWETQVRRLESHGTLGLGPLLAHWCPAVEDLEDSARYPCMREQITPAQVFSAILNVL